MILETSFPPLMGQKGANELKITSEELSWMEHTCTSLISQAENTLGFQLSSHRARSLLHEKRTAGKGERRGPSVPGYKADAPGCGEGRIPCERRGLGLLLPGPGDERLGCHLPVRVLCSRRMESKQTPERGRADTCLLLVRQVQ